METATAGGVATPEYLIAIETKMKYTKSKAPRGGPSSKCSKQAPSSSDPQENYDYVPLNPLGRGMHDGSKAEGRLLSCKQYNYVATFNARTLRLENKRKELVNCFKEQSIAILGIVDHKIVHKEDDDDIVYDTVEDGIFITSSAWRNSRNAASGGVGLVVNKIAAGTLAEVIKWNRRIIVANFSGNPSLTIIVHYSPVEGDEEAEDHYGHLSAAVKEVPKHNMLVVMGDFNAHLDRSIAKYSYHEACNNNGRLVTNFIQEANLFVASANFQKKQAKLWTYISDMSGSKTQVDYIMVNRKWKNSVHDCQAYNAFSSVGSDHRIVTAKFKLSLRTSRAVPQRINYQWSALQNKELKDLYTVTVRNMYENLCMDNETITETYANLIKANEETAKEVLPKKERTRKKKVSNDPRVVKAREETQNATNRYLHKSNARNREELQKCKHKLQETYDTITEEELDKMIREVEAADEKSKHKESWNVINEITGRKTTKQSIIKAKDKKDRINKWYTHFKDLLGKEPVVEGGMETEITPVLQGMQISDEPFTAKEYATVKKSIKEGKACGPDGIPPEVFKHVDLDNIMLGFANKLLDGEKPEQWSNSELKPLPKSGDLSTTDNYRGISLSVIAAKLVNKMLLNRIRSKIDKHLRPNQNGFRPGRSTTAHILTLRRLIEGVRSHNLKAVLVFIDFKKAFDSIHRERMLQILRAYDIPEKLVNAIGLMYQNTKARVLTPDGETELFEILAGVLQGDTLAPYIFAIVLDYVMRKAIGGREEELGFKLDRRRSRRHHPVILTDTDFADDIAITTEEISQAQEMLKCIEIEAAKVGLHLNAKKTEVMHFNQEGDATIKTRNGNALKSVDNFKYLGCWMKSTDKDFEIRKALAWSACHKMKRIWSTNLKRNIKVRLFVTTVESILLYGSETWTINKVMEKRLNGCYTRMLRMALNVSWRDKLTNEQLYRDLPPVSSKVGYRRLKLAGHCVRHPEEEASKLVLWQPTIGRMNVGRRAITYIDTLMRDTNLASVNELRTSMMDREDWRRRADLKRVEARPK